MNAKDIIVSALLFSFVIIAGTYILDEMSGESTELPGYETGEELREKVTSYAGDVKDVAEEPESASIGLTGLAGLIKLVLLDAPIYAASVITEVVAYFGLPITLAYFLIAIVIIVVVYEAILLYRGVKS